VPALDLHAFVSERSTEVGPSYSVSATTASHPNEVHYTDPLGQVRGVQHAELGVELLTTLSPSSKT
jgi:hypothetical protein